jgi:RNA-directed DNA polymerase
MPQTPIRLQDRRRRIDTKAPAEPSWRFWGLDVPVGQRATLRAASRMAQENHGAPGRDGGTCEALEADGGETFLQPLQDALVPRTYRPRRLRHKALPTENGPGGRGLSLSTIRDRGVQGACQRMLAPLLAAECQPGADGYRPQRSAPDAVLRVAEAIVQDKTRVIDVDGPAYFATLRQPRLLAPVAQRGKDPEGLHGLKRVRRASGQKGVAQGGGLSPLLRQLSLTAVDRRLERAHAVTRRGSSPSRAEARCAAELGSLGEA